MEAGKPARIMVKQRFNLWVMWRHMIEFAQQSTLQHARQDMPPLLNSERCHRTKSHVHFIQSIFVGITEAFSNIGPGTFLRPSPCFAYALWLPPTPGNSSPTPGNSSPTFFSTPHCSVLIDIHWPWSWASTLLYPYCVP